MIPGNSSRGREREVDVCYHLSKFHIYVLVYCIGVFLSGLTSLCTIGSSFIHLIRTDSNVFFFLALFCLGTFYECENVLSNDRQPRCRLPCIQLPLVYTKWILKLDFDA